MKEFLQRAVNFLTRAHPRERRKGIWFQVEAKAERSANVIRSVYVLVWFVSTLVHAPGNAFWSNVANLGVGGYWLVWCMGYQAYLLRYPYLSKFKYLSTVMDMLVITAMLSFYARTAGPAYALKVPTFYNYFCCLGLAALRYRLYLALFSGLFASICYGLLFLYFYLEYPIKFGTTIEHTLTDKISGSYILFNEFYIIIFTFLIYFLVYNVKRLVDLRIREGEAAVKAKERAAIAASVAHEIKNPLEGIYGAAQLLKEEGKANVRFVDMILKDAVRLNGVVQQFLQFSRPFKVSLGAFDAVAQTREFCREQASLAGESKVRFLSDAEAAPVQADQEGLRQVLLNLYQNARRYQQPDRPVEMRVRDRGEQIEIAVEDDGEGVPEANHDKVFDPFFTTSTKGTGLGLAISRKIAREMGGDLYFEPKQPGARFVLVLRPAPIGEKTA